MSEPKRYDVGMTTEFNPHGFNHSFPRVYEAEEGKYVEYSDYARLKAEVERLTSDIQMEKENEDRLVREWQRANNEVYGLQTQVAALIDDQTRLKAEVKRLTKAGDNLEQVLTEISYSYRAGNASHEWRAAKGVQS